MGDVEVAHDEKHDESHRKTSVSSLTDNLERSTSSEKESIHTALKYDQHGLPLIPQPSRFRDDPLVRYQMPTQFAMILTSDRTGLHG